MPEAEPDEVVLRLGVLTYGTSRGGQPTLREYQCHAGGQVFYANSSPSLLPTSPKARSRARLRAFAVAPLGEVGCGLADLEGAGPRIQRDRLTARLGPPGRYKLVLRAGGDVPAWLSVRVDHLAIRGARIAEAPASDPARAAIARAAVEGDAAGALAALLEAGPAGPREQALLALLLVQAGRPGEAEPLWRALLADADPAAQAALHTLLRGHHAAVGPVLRAMAEPRYVELLATAWHNTAVNHLDDPRVGPDFLDILSGLAPERLISAESTHEERLRAADLLAWRGRLQRAARRPSLAREDLSRALELCRRADQGVSTRASLLLLDLASLAAEAGDRTTAHDRVEEARAAASMPLLVEDIVRARPELAGLAGGG